MDMILDPVVRGHGHGARRWVGTVCDKCLFNYTRSLSEEPIAVLAVAVCNYACRMIVNRKSAYSMHSGVFRGALCEAPPLAGPL